MDSLKGLGNLTFKISGDNLTLRCDYNGEPFNGSFYKQSHETFEEVYSDMFEVQSINSKQDTLTVGINGLVRKEEAVTVYLHRKAKPLIIDVEQEVTTLKLPPKKNAAGPK